MSGRMQSASTGVGTTGHKSLSETMRNGRSLRKSTRRPKSQGRASPGAPAMSCLVMSSSLLPTATVAFRPTESSRRRMSARGWWLGRLGSRCSTPRASSAAAVSTLPPQTLSSRTTFLSLSTTNCTSRPSRSWARPPPERPTLPLLMAGCPACCIMLVPVGQRRLGARTHTHPEAHVARPAVAPVDSCRSLHAGLVCIQLVHGHCTHHGATGARSPSSSASGSLVRPVRTTGSPSSSSAVATVFASKTRHGGLCVAAQHLFTAAAVRGCRKIRPPAIVPTSAWVPDAPAMQPPGVPQPSA